MYMSSKTYSHTRPQEMNNQQNLFEFDKNISDMLSETSKMFFMDNNRKFSGIDSEEISNYLLTNLPNQEYAFKYRNNEELECYYIPKLITSVVDDIKKLANSIRELLAIRQRPEFLQSFIADITTLSRGSSIGNIDDLKIYLIKSFHPRHIIDFINLKNQIHDLAYSDYHFPHMVKIASTVIGVVPTISARELQLQKILIAIYTKMNNLINTEEFQFTYKLMEASSNINSTIIKKEFPQHADMTIGEFKALLYKSTDDDDDLYDDLYEGKTYIEILIKINNKIF